MEKTDSSTYIPVSSENFVCIDSTNESGPPKLSKNQQKRLLREAKRKETKAEWRKLQKAKRKLKEQLKKEECVAKGNFKLLLWFFKNLTSRRRIPSEKTR